MLVLAVIILGILLVGVRLVGLEPYTVISGSMEPTYHVGSLIYVKKVDPMTLQEGDPITFYLNDNTIVTHRIIEVITDEDDPTARSFRTQGNANDTPDGDPVRVHQVIGKPILSIPYLGYLALYIQQPPGRFVALGFCLALLAAILLVDLIKALFSSDKSNEGEGDPPAQA